MPPRDLVAEGGDRQSPNETAAVSAPWQPRANPWLITFAVMLPTFMEILDTSIVNVALPHIAGNLSAGTDEATWVLTSYLVSNAIVLPAAAWFGSVVGRKRFLMVCIALFTFSSALCGGARTLALLIAMRVVQGAGGGALPSISQAILLESFPPARHGIAMAAYGAGVVIAPIIGPTLGGWLTDAYSWRWTFYINVPVGVLAILLVQLFVEEPPYIKHRGRLRVDYLGFGLMALALGTLQVVLDRGQKDDWFDAAWIRWATAVMLTSGAAFVVRELKVRQPIVDLRVLADRNFALGTVFMGIVGVVLYSTTALLPLFMQTLINYPAFQSGLALTPRGLGSLAAMVIVGRLVGRIDARLLIGAGFLLFGVSCVRFGGFTLDISMRHVVEPAILNGFALAFLFVPLATQSMATLVREDVGNASGIFNLMRNIGGGIGIAAATTMLSRGAQMHQALLVRHLTPYDPASQQWLGAAEHFLAGRAALAPSRQALGVLYGTLVQQATLAAFVDVFRFLAIACFLCVPAALLLRRARGAAAVSVH